MKLFMLDTCVCVQMLRRRGGAVLRKLSRLEVGAVGVSAITVAELRYGAAKCGNPAKSISILRQFMAPLAVWPFGSLASDMYGDMRADLERTGDCIGPLDMLIAAHALAMDATLITSNEAEFRRVPGLRVENWVG